MKQSLVLMLSMVVVGLVGSAPTSASAGEQDSNVAKEKLANDPHADFLQRHYPHGIHKLRTDKNDGSIQWYSETLSDGKVVRSTARYPSLDDFKAALRARALHKKAYIEIAGMWHHASAPQTDEKGNEALLEVLRDEGYEEARFANLKKYYGPHGHHFIDAQRADGKIRWNSSVIVMNRVKRTNRKFSSMDEFKKAFLAAMLDKSTQIEVHYRPGKFRGDLTKADAILAFLRQSGYERVGAVSN